MQHPPLPWGVFVPLLLPECGTLLLPRVLWMLMRYRALSSSPLRERTRFFNEIRFMNISAALSVGGGALRAASRLLLNGKSVKSLDEKMKNDFLFFSHSLFLRKIKKIKKKSWKIKKMQDAALPLKSKRIALLECEDSLGFPYFSRSDFRVSRISLKYVPRNGARGERRKEIRRV